MDEGDFAEQAFEVQVTSKVKNKENNLVNTDLTTNVHNKIPLFSNEQKNLIKK